MNELALDKIRKAREFLEKAEQELIKGNARLSLGYIDEVDFSCEGAKWILIDEIHRGEDR